MGRVDEILAKQKQLKEELELAKVEEKADVLKDIRAKIEMFGFKASDFKGLLKSRISKKQAEEFLAKKTTAVAKKPVVKRSKA